MASREIASQTLQFLSDLVRASVWRTLFLLPWTLITSVAVLLAVAGPGQHLSNLEQGSSVIQWFSLTVWFTCFGIAGVLWGIHRALDHGLHDGITMCQTRGAEAASAALDPVLASLPVGKTDYPIDVIRKHWNSAASEMVFPNARSGWFSPVARLTNLAARLWVRAQTAVVTQTLDELEAFGEKSISAESLKRFIVHRSAAAMAESARRNLRFWSLVTAAVVFLLIVTPAALTTTINLLTKNG